MLDRTEPLDDLLEECWDTMVSEPDITLQALLVLREKARREDHLLGKALFYTGCCYVYCGDFLAAVQELNAAIELAQVEHDLHQIRRVHNILGTAYKSLGEYGKAVYALDFAIELSKELDFPDGQVVAQLNLINLYYDVGDFESCEQNLTELRSLEFDQNNEEVRGEIFLIEARMYLSKFDYEHANAALCSASDIANRLQYSHLKINTWIQQGRLLRLQGRFQESISLFEQIHADPGFPYEGVAGLACDVEWGKALLSTGSFDSAKQLLQSALVQLDVERNDHHRIRLELVELLSRCLKSLGDYESACHYFEQALELRSTVSREKINRTLAIRKQQQLQENEKIQQALTERENQYLKSSQRQLTTINHVAIELASSLRLEEIGDKLFDLMEAFFNAHFISVALHDEENDAAVFRIIIDNGKAQPTYCLPMSTDDSRVVQTIKSGEPITIRDNSIVIRSGSPALKPMSQLFLPLKQDSTTLGVLSVQSVHKNQFQGDELALILAISPFLTLALTNALSHEQVHDLNSRLVHEKQVIEDAQEQIKFMALHDSLTKMPNRRALENHLTQLIKNEQNQPGFSLVYIDLDRFKPINDQYGHLVGDRVLQITAERIGNQLRKGDFAARIGGDEFVLVVHAVSDERQMQAMMSRFFSSIEQPIVLDQNTMSVSASIGIVNRAEQSQSIDEILHQADLAMYEVKRTGKGGIKYFA
jgi:diguanylate cyclase (GGDEF)-like protein